MKKEHENGEFIKKIDRLFTDLQKDVNFEEILHLQDANGKTFEKGFFMLAFDKTDVHTDGGTGSFVSVAGTTEDVENMLLGLMKRHPEMIDIFKSAVAKADLQKTKNSFLDNLNEFMKTGVCNCPSCTERRNHSKSNPNVN